MSDPITAAQLNALAAGLCLDAGIRVEAEPGPLWSWDPVRRVIRVSADDLQQRGPRYCAGILAHEVGHVFISRYLHLSADPARRPAVREPQLVQAVRNNQLNAIEDARCETWMARRYPGCRDWFREAVEIELMQPDAQEAAQPDSLRFALECARERALDWQAAPAKFAVPPEVAVALEATRPARRAYAEHLPPVDLAAIAFEPERAERYRQEVWLRLKDAARRQWPSPWEQEVRLRAWEALMLAEREVLPAAFALLEADIARLAGGLREDPALRRTAQTACQQGDPRALWAVLNAVFSARRPVNTTAGSAETRLAEKLLLNLLQGQSGAGREGPLISVDGIPPGAAVVPLPPGILPPPGAVVVRHPPLALPPAADYYEQARRRIALQIDALAARMATILRPRQRLGEHSGYPSGHRLDLNRVMAFDADPRRYRELWRRKSVPDRREAAVFLLVDLSGSMAGEKSEAALLGTVLVAETLHRLGVPFAVAGFQDELIPFVEFNDDLGPATRQTLGEMPLEVTDSRPGGHNQRGYNDDGPCLLAAAEQLLARSASERVLLAVSDGRPEGRHSGEADLRRAVATLTATGQGLELIGIGLGPGTEHVSDFYPQAVANVPVPEFAQRIGDVLERVLVGGG